MPIERLTGPTGPNGVAVTAPAMRSASRNASERPLAGTMIANSSPPIRQTVSLERTAARRIDATSESTWSPVAWL